MNNVLTTLAGSGKISDILWVTIWPPIYLLITTPDTARHSRQTYAGQQRQGGYMNRGNRGERQRGETEGRDRGER